MKNYITIKRVLMVILSIILTVNIYSQNKKIFFNSDNIQVLKVESFDSIRKGNDYIILMCGSSLSDTSIISIDKKIVQASLRKNISEDQEEVKHKKTGTVQDRPFFILLSAVCSAPRPRGRACGLCAGALPRGNPRPPETFARPDKSGVSPADKALSSRLRPCLQPRPTGCASSSRNSPLWAI